MKFQKKQGNTKSSSTRVAKQQRYDDRHVPLSRYNVQPIKDKKTLEAVYDTLKNDFAFGIRNYTIFRVGMTTMLRVSDVLNLRTSEIFDENGTVHRYIRVRDIKTQKPHDVFLDNAAEDLEQYWVWLKEHGIKSEYLFPAMRLHSRYHTGATRYDKPIREKSFYEIMRRTGRILGIDYLGTHTMRKTGGYWTYLKTGKDLGFVMKMLNHANEQSTLHYIGIDQEVTQSRLKQIKL